MASLAVKTAGLIRGMLPEALARRAAGRCFRQAFHLPTGVCCFTLSSIWHATNNPFFTDNAIYPSPNPTDSSCSIIDEFPPAQYLGFVRKVVHSLREWTRPAGITNVRPFLDVAQTVQTAVFKQSLVLSRPGAELAEDHIDVPAPLLLCVRLSAFGSFVWSNTSTVHCNF